MPETMHLYLDDSGTRNPDHKSTVPPHGHDWFAMGGVLIRKRDEDAVRERYADLRADWEITYPLHSHEIRNSKNNFSWVRGLPPERFDRFMSDLRELATMKELTALACVIDRPGYNRRYSEKYGRAKWSLCKTAFDVVVERAAKFARAQGCKLRVYTELSDEETDKRLRGYYDALRTTGLPFDPATSSRYSPLTADEFRETLYEFKIKWKSSPLMQIADLCLWPICMGGYDRNNRPYVALRDAGTLIDCKIPEDSVGVLGIKYSCHDADTEKTKTQS